MGQAGGIRFFQVFQGCLRIRAETGLIAHRPEDNGGTVLVAVIEQAYPVHPGFLKVRMTGYLIIPGIISVQGNHAVGLQIPFVTDIESAAIAKLQEIRRIWIMGSPDGIYVMLLHNLKVPDNGVISNCRPRNRIAVVAVYSPDFDFPAV